MGFRKTRQLYCDGQTEKNTCNRNSVRNAGGIRPAKIRTDARRFARRKADVETFANGAQRRVGMRPDGGSRRTYAGGRRMGQNARPRLLLRGHRKEAHASVHCRKGKNATLEGGQQIRTLLDKARRENPRKLARGNCAESRARHDRSAGFRKRQRRGNSLLHGRQPRHLEIRESGRNGFNRAFGRRTQQALRHLLQQARLQKGKARPLRRHQRRRLPDFAPRGRADFRRIRKDERRA